MGRSEDGGSGGEAGRRGGRGSEWGWNRDKHTSLAYNLCRRRELMYTARGRGTTRRPPRGLDWERSPEAWRGSSPRRPGGGGRLPEAWRGRAPAKKSVCLGRSPLLHGRQEGQRGCRVHMRKKKRRGGQGTRGQRGGGRRGKKGGGARG